MYIPNLSLQSKWQNHVPPRHTEVSSGQKHCPDLSLWPTFVPQVIQVYFLELEFMLYKFDNGTIQCIMASRVMRMDDVPNNSHM